MKNNRISRRQFMHCSAAGAAYTVSSKASAGPAATLPHRSEGTTDTCVASGADVLVVGGGAAGTIAAIQASRAGAKTVLIERGSQLGGMTTTAGVSFPGLFDAWGRQIIAGIGWELVKECVQLDGGTLPDFSRIPKRHWMNQVRVNQFLYVLLAEDKCQKAGVEINYYESPQSITQTTKGWHVECAGFGTRRRVRCKQIIDCTGGAEVVGMLNLPRLRGRERQPGSMLFKLDKANNPGRPNGPGSGLLDSVYIHGADSTNSRTVTSANIKGRKEVLKMVRSGNRRLMHLQPEAGFRESYRIQGETLITVEDYTSGRVFEDAVCYAFYPVDLHTRNGVTPKPLSRGTVPTIPLSALVPKGSSNIIVAGRALSSDRLANSGLRVQASCMAMGQAAGAAAALAAQKKTTPLKVPLKEIKEMLLKHGAIIPTV